MANAVKYSTTGDTQSLKKGNIYLGVGDVGKGPSSATTYYNGVTPVSSGYTIYSYNASQTSKLSYNSSNNDASLITYTNGISGQNFSTATQCLNWYATQTNYVCINRDYENIITSGLTFIIDAGFTPSYTSSGTTWYDLSYNNNNGTLTNGPTFSTSNGGSIVFDGVDDYMITPSLSLSSPTTCLTFNFWVKSTGQTSAVQTILGKDTNVGNIPHILIGRTANSDNLRWNYNNGTGAATISFLNFFTGYNNTWINIQIVADYNLDIVTVYRNGAQFGQQSQPSAVFPDTNTVLYLSSFALNAFLVFNGNIASSQIYNRALSAQEVLQNYNATKTRYGLI